MLLGLIESRKENRWIIAVFLVMLLFGMPWVALHVYAGIMLPFFVLVFSFLVFRSKEWFHGSKKSLIIALFIIELFEIMHNVTEGRPAIIALYSSLASITPVILTFYSISKKDNKLIKSLIYLFVIVYSIEAVTTILGLKAFPEASRILASSNAEESAPYLALNIGGFGFIYTLVLCHTLVPALYKQHRIPLIAALVITFLWGVCILFSSYTIAILLYAASVFIYFLPQRMSSRSLGVIIAVFIVLLIIYPSIGDLLVTISDMNFIQDLPSVQERLYDLGIAMNGENVGNSSDFAIRQTAYSRSWNGFLNNLLGFSFVDAGGHSYVLDRMARYGIWSLFVFIYYYRSLYRVVCKSNKKQPFFYYVVFAFVVSIVLSFLNPSLWYSATLIFTPLVTCYLSNNGNE